MAPAILTNILPLYPFPNLTNGTQPAFDFLSTETTRDDYGQIRIDHNLSSTDTLFGRYTIDDSQQVRPITYPGFDNAWTQRSQYLTLSESHIFSPTILNSARFSYSRSNVYQVAQTPGYTGPTCATGALTVCGLAGNPVSSLGLGTSNPVFQTQNVFSWGDDVFWTKGKHALKFGTLINYWQQFVDNNAKAGGLINFSSFADVSSG